MKDESAWERESLEVYHERKLSVGWKDSFFFVSLFNFLLKVINPFEIQSKLRKWRFTRHTMFTPRNFFLGFSSLFLSRVESAPMMMLVRRLNSILARVWSKKQKRRARMGKFLKQQDLFSAFSNKHYEISFQNLFSSCFSLSLLPSFPPQRLPALLVCHAMLYTAEINVFIFLFGVSTFHENLIGG